MNKVILFGAAAVLVLSGCESPHRVGAGSYGYTYDLDLPIIPATAMVAGVSGPPSAIVAATPEGTSQFEGPAPQSVVFYEGAQPTQGAVVAGTPVWTPPGSVPSVPGAVPINEAAGAAVGTAPAAVAGGAVAAPGVAPSVVVGGDGGAFGGSVIGTNTGVLTNQGITINNTNSNSIILTNGLTNAIGNITNTNGFPITNSMGGITNTNGSFVAATKTNLTGTSTNFTATNATAANIIGAPVAGATNNQNNLPRAVAPPPGAPPGTTLVPARPIGQPPTALQSQVISGTTTAPNTPTQPGPTTSTTTTQGGTTPTTTTGGQTSATGAQGTTTTTTSGTVVRPSTSTAQQRILLNRQQTTQGTRTTTQGTQAAPATTPNP